MRTVLPYVAFFRRFIARSVEREMRVRSECAATSMEEELAPRVESQASDLSWFAEEVQEEDFLWVFSRECKAFRVIATLEALAILWLFGFSFPRQKGR